MHAPVRIAVFESGTQRFCRYISTAIIEQTYGIYILQRQFERQRYRISIIDIWRISNAAAACLLGSNKCDASLAL